MDEGGAEVQKEGQGNGEEGERESGKEKQNAERGSREGEIDK